MSPSRAYRNSLPETVEWSVSTVLENGKASLEVQHLIPPTPRQWSAAVGGQRLQLPTGASRPATGAPEVSPRLQLVNIVDVLSRVEKRVRFIETETADAMLLLFLNSVSELLYITTEEQVLLLIIICI